MDPLKFTELILGTCWIDDAAFQSFCITYLSRLKARRAELLCLNSGVTGPELPPEILSGGENTLRIFPPPRAGVLG